MTSCTVTIKTPIGLLTLSEYDGFITQCQFTKKRSQQEKVSSLLRTAQRQLEEYFSAQRTDFDLPIATSGTPFQGHVWATLQTIPYGKQWSYQELARELGNSKASRAVGSANAQNPICIIIPCHRVIRTSGEPGKYAGGDDIKVKLLDLEQKGVSISYKNSEEMSK